MAKKKEEVKDVVETVNVLTEINLDFGREDLNLLRDKVNELVRNLQ